MTWCVAVDCGSNFFTKNRVKGLRFFQLSKNESFKEEMASKHQKRKPTEESNSL